MGVPEHFRCYLQWSAARGVLNHRVINLQGNLNDSLLCCSHSYNSFPVGMIHDRSRENLQWKYTSLCFITCQVL